MPPANQAPEPPGNTGTHQPPLNKYLLSQIQRANYITSRRQPFTDAPDPLATQLQRLVHHEGNRPPNRKILLQLRLLAYYPPVPDLIPDLIILLESQNAHVCRLAHYHIRQLAPIDDPELHRSVLDVLQRQSVHQSPARRACATKTYAKLTRAADSVQAVQFVSNVFNAIGGARVAQPMTAEQEAQRRREKREEKNEKKTLQQRATNAFGSIKVGRPIVRGTPYEPSLSESADMNHLTQMHVDDGAGGKMGGAANKKIFIRSRYGKMLVGHCTIAALRRVNRMAAKGTRLESYFFDSGLLSIVPSTVRHTVAMLEMRAAVVPGPVSRYLAARLPHKNPPPEKTLHLEELGARVYYARLLAALAEDPDLTRYIPEEKAKKGDGLGGQTLKEAVTGVTYQEKASNLFKFLFNHTKRYVGRAADAVKQTTQDVSEIVSDSLVVRKPRLQRNDPLGVEFAEALVNLLKNPSNRVLVEALRGLSRRKWTTWFENPIPAAALYNTPELSDAPYSGTTDAWDIEEEEDGKMEFGMEGDEDELGAYEDDVVGDAEDGESKDKAQGDAVEGQELEPASNEKLSWRARLVSKRGERRVARVDKGTPMFLRDVGYGMVPALEVILRRLNAGLVEDEPIRRFSSADAIIVLARAKIYGHTEEDHAMFRRAQSAVQTARRSAQMRALVLHQKNGGPGLVGGSFDGEQHPFEGLVKPLAEVVDEELNPFVQGRAAAALLFIVAAGAGRQIPELDNAGVDAADGSIEKAEKLQETPLLLRYFARYVTSEDVGHGVGLRIVSELIDYLVYELLDIAPDLAPSALEMAERWAYRHPTVGVCGRLGALWEKVLSIGQGHEVGKSIFRAMDVAPGCERVAAAATIFLRRRTLDIAMISAGSTDAETVPEPLPRDVGVEMEKYFSLLWHTALLGPSAECRKFAVESMGGAAALAGEPFRICTYERLVELVRLRGLGVKVAAEQVLDCLDTLYFCRERFSEARAQNKVARDGSNRARPWLELVWKLTAEASSAAQILLGVPPPTGWQPLGGGAAADVRNAQAAFGDVRDRQDAAKLREESVAAASAGADVPVFDAMGDFVRIPRPAAEREKPAGAADGQDGVADADDVAEKLDDLALPSETFGAVGGRENGRERSRSRSRSRSRGRRYDDDEPVVVDDEEVHDGGYERRGSFLGGGRRRFSRRGSSRNHEDEQYWDEYEQGGDGERRRRRRDDDGRYGEADRYDDRDRRYSEAPDGRRRQEEADLELARRLQEEEGGRRASEARPGAAAGAAGAAAAAAGAGAEMLQATGQKLMRYGALGRKALTEKVIKSAARSSAMDKLRGSSSRR